VSLFWVSCKPCWQCKSVFWFAEVCGVFGSVSLYRVLCVRWPGWRVQGADCRPLELLQWMSIMHMATWLTHDFWQTQGVTKSARVPTTASTRILTGMILSFPAHNNYYAAFSLLRSFFCSHLCAKFPPCCGVRRAWVHANMPVSEYNSWQCLVLWMLRRVESLLVENLAAYS
jgi:hypothetical protein